VKKWPNQVVTGKQTRSHFRQCMNSLGLILVFLLAGGSSFAQVTITEQAQGAGATPATGAPVTITLQDALERARSNNPQYRSALTDLGLAREDRLSQRRG